MEYKNLDKAEAFSVLLKEEKKDIKTLLTSERVKKSEIKRITEKIMVQSKFY